MNRIILLLLLVSIYAPTAQAQLVQVTPESQRFSSLKLHLIPRMIQQEVSAGKTPGAAYLIARNGKIVAYESVGFRDMESQTVMHRDDIFRIASQTKAVTSVAAMILYEEGKLLLDEPVATFIPSFRHPRVIDQYHPADTTYTTVPANWELCIRDLLTHTSGIAYNYFGDPRLVAIYAKNGIELSELENHIPVAVQMERLGSLPLAHQPSTAFTYGLNTDILGYIIEQVTGIPLSDFCRIRIFEPLGMKDTYFYLPPSKYHRLVTLYTADSTKKLVRADSTFSKDYTYVHFPKTNGTYFSGGGGLSSTVLDYGIFLQMLLNNGIYHKHRLLSKNTVRMMTTNQLGGITPVVEPFGLGFYIVNENRSARTGMSVGSYGWAGAYSTYYWVDPNLQLIAVFHKQTTGETNWQTFEKFRAMVYAAMLDK